MQRNLSTHTGPIKRSAAPLLYVAPKAAMERTTMQFPSERDYWHRARYITMGQRPKSMTSAAQSTGTTSTAMKVMYCDLLLISTVFAYVTDREVHLKRTIQKYDGDKSA